MSHDPRILAVEENIFQIVRREISPVQHGFKIRFCEALRIYQVSIEMDRYGSGEKKKQRK